MSLLASRGFFSGKEPIIQTPRQIKEDRYVRRVTIEGVEPEIDAGRFPAKCVVGEALRVRADVFTDGHDVIAGRLLYRPQDAADWRESPLEPLVNDRYEARFTPDALGYFEFTLEAWVDHFATWLADLRKRVAAGQDDDVAVQLQIGAKMLSEAAARASGADKQQLAAWAKKIESRAALEVRVAIVESPELHQIIAAHPDRSSATRYAKELRVWVDPPKARFSAWYEFFPRSSWNGSGAHASLRDCEARLDYVAEMGFDVVYLTPIHPIGKTYRKGPNNALKAGPKDPGSPWAIGSEEGGHKAIHPQLGTSADLRWFVERARERNIDVALDIALQCSPDHPYVREHPQWFRHRPDGTIQYAENPPKKYQDIYPLEFESTGWQALWEELRDVFLHWINHGIHIFRVDNPHTKPFRFWEWCIHEIKERHPDVLFLAEAFTRPKVMYHLAKLGFSQSYTYFAWRTHKRDLTEYLTELTQTDVKYFFRPNFWPNTPDILTEQLQTGSPPMFKARVTLAATMSSNYGIYGPAFELMEHHARPGVEEYIDNEKFEIKTWDVRNRASIRDFIQRLNRIRHENAALHYTDNVQFHEIQHDDLICYSKVSPDGGDAVVVIVNLNPYETRGAWAHIPAARLGVLDDAPYQVHDLLGDGRYTWQGDWNYVELNPYQCPAHILRVRRRVRSEHDFDYYE